MPPRFIVAARRVVSCAQSALGSAHAIDEGAVLIERDRIAAIGPREQVVALDPHAPVVAEGSLITPGLVDAHTHSAWVGSRHDEYAVRLAGGDYEAIAKAGGGIVSTMRAIREASHDEIAGELRSRLARMASLGVTTVEVKSGYGLDETSERKLLEVIDAVSREENLPRVVATYLALHAIPPERRADRDAYVHEVATQWVPAIASRRLARFVDVYVDRNAFTVDEGRRVLTAAREHGLGLRIHAGQFADIGAVEMASALGAASADHLEHVSAQGLATMAKAGTHGILLPTASWTLGQAAPPIAAMREAGVTLVVASDANPGTAPTESLPLAMAMAARLYGLTPDEVLRGATAHASSSLGLDDVGTLRVGASADLVLWDLPHEKALIQPWGTSRASLVIGRGSTLFDARS